jgi:hypothetical protein
MTRRPHDKIEAAFDVQQGVWALDAFSPAQGHEQAWFRDFHRPIDYKCDDIGYLGNKIRYAPRFSTISVLPLSRPRYAKTKLILQGNMRVRPPEQSVSVLQASWNSETRLATRNFVPRE